jgi:cytoskeletal protein CcmA (bactofilin family)
MVEKAGDHGPEGAIFIGAGVEIKGEMTVPGCATVDGRFEGALKAKSLVVGQTGHVSGDISVEIAEVRGTVGDNLAVRSRLVVRSSGIIAGSCSYSKIMVEEGGELSGSIEKIAPAPAEQKVVSLQRGD